MTKRLPTIIEQGMNLFNPKKVTKLVLNFANIYADKETVQSSVVLDIYPLSGEYMDKKIHLKSIIKLFKDMNQISKKLNAPIIVVYNIDVEKKYNAETYQPNYIEKQDIEYVNKINKYIDKTIIVNLDKQQEDIYNLDVYDTNSKITTAKLKYDFKYRKFIN